MSFKEKFLNLLRNFFIQEDHYFECFQFYIETLPKGYCDVPEKMLHANFQMLKNFVENEYPFEYIDWSENKEIENEIRCLYNWWTKERPDREKGTVLAQKGLPFDFILSDKNKKLYKMIRVGTPKEIEEEKERTKKRIELMEKFRKDDQDNLIRLIKIREYLWT